MRENAKKLSPKDRWLNPTTSSLDNTTRKIIFKRTFLERSSFPNIWKKKIWFFVQWYVSSSEYAIVTQGSVENDPSYVFDRVLSISRVLIMLGFEYTRVVNMTWLHRVLCKLYFKDSRYFECLEFWIC